MANSYLNPAATSGLTTYKQNQLGHLQPLVSDLLTSTQRNSYTNPILQGDSTAIKNRLGEYSVYDANQLGGLASYYTPYADTTNKNQLYFKPSEFQSLSEGITGFDQGTLSKLQPMLGGLQSVGAYGEKSYYQKDPLQQQLGKYSSVDLSPYSKFSSVQALKPVTELDGKKYYSRADLEGLQNAKNYWGYVDPTVGQLLGGSYGVDDRGAYTTGMIDPTKFQIGDAGFGRQDIGGGKYNILGANGQVLGTGYKSTAEASKELLRESLGIPALEQQKQAALAKYGFIPEYLKQSVFDPENPSFIMPTDFWLRNAGLKTDWKTQEDFRKAAESYSSAEEALKKANEKLAYDKYIPNAATDWERIGQSLNPKQSVNGAFMQEAADQKQAWNDLRFRLPINSNWETLSGEQTMYGSTPVFNNGVLIGYKNSLAMNPGTADPFGFSYSTDKGDSKGYARLGRDLTDVEKWKTLVSGLGDNNVFIPTANVSQLPGWTNTEKTAWWERPENSFATQVAKVVVPAVLNYVVPGLGNVASAFVAKNQGNDAGMWGNLAMAAFGASGLSGDMGSSAGAPVETGVSTAGNAANTMGSSAGGLFGSGVSLGSAGLNAAVQGGLTNAAVGGLSQALAGNGSQAVLQALGSGALSGALGPYLNSLSSGYSPLAQLAMRGGTGALLGGAQAALAGGKFGQGALGGLTSGALGAAGGLAGRYANDAGYGRAFNTAMTVANPVIQQLLRARRT